MTTEQMDWLDERNPEWQAKLMKERKAQQARDFKPLRAPGRGPGGWYCDHCGYTTGRLPGGVVICPRCGSIGLMGFAGKAPMLMPCLEGGCPEKVWFDGVNSYPARLR